MPNPAAKTGSLPWPVRKSVEHSCELSATGVHRDLAPTTQVSTARPKGLETRSDLAIAAVKKRPCHLPACPIESHSMPISRIPGLSREKISFAFACLILLQGCSSPKPQIRSRKDPAYTGKLERVLVIYHNERDAAASL